MVFEGSQLAKHHLNSIHNYILTKRESLVQDQAAELDSKCYVFKKDHLFSSPSQAAAVILGRNANGWTAWKNVDGVTLDQIKRKNMD